MTYKITVPGMAGQTKPTNPPPTPTIVLQRLANPLLPTGINPAPGQPIDWTKPINPLVTVDVPIYVSEDVLNEVGQ